MGKYHLLIIDDDLPNRKRGYDAILGNDYFDLQYIESASPRDLQRINDSKAHAFLLDVNLDKWSNIEIGGLFRDICERIGKKAPVFLISNKWGQENIRWVNQSKDLITIKYYVSWDSDFQALLRTNEYSYSSLRENIKKELDDYYEKDNRVLNDEESINILQLSDIQFGDNGFDRDAKLLEHLVPKYLSSKDLSNIHLLVLSGDIAFSGSPGEYSEALDWFNRFCPEVLGKDYRSKIILVPGNHDVNLKLTAIDNYTLDFKTGKLIDTDIKSSEHHEYGLTPFRKFAFELTQNAIWLIDSNKLCFVNDRFLNWGLRFYHLNSVVELNYAQPDFCSIPERILGTLLNTTKESKDVYEIIVCHHHPYAFGYKPLDVSDSRWIAVRNFIESTNSQLFLHGHSHMFKTYNINEEGNRNKKIIYHMTSTLSLSKTERTKDALRGFSLIQLGRTNGKIDPEKVKITSFEIAGERIKEKIE